MEKATQERFCGGFRVFVIALHYRIPAHHDLALRGTIHWGLHAGAVDNRCEIHHRHGDALASFEGRLFVLGQAVPSAIPKAFDHMAIGFGQPINLSDVEAQFSYARQSGRCGWGACGEQFNCVIKISAVFCSGVNDHIEHNRSASEMRHAFICDSVIDCLG